MSVESAIAAGRTAAESRMLSRASVMRDMGMQPGPGGLEVPTWEAVYTDLPFRLGGANAGSSSTRTVTVGGVETRVAIRVGHLPADTVDLHDNDLIDVTDGEHAGIALQIVEATGADQQTSRRLPVFEVPRPADWS